MLLNLLLVLEVIVSFFLIVVVLLQRSEGGALGMGGGPSGFMTARGAGDFLTRLTWILGSLFFILGLTLTVVAGRERGSSSVVDRLKVDAINPAAALAPQPAAPPANAPVEGQAPLQAPTPTINNPFGGPAPVQTVPAQPQPAAPAQPQ
jgi:preprotein translocase subunit SecG